MQTQPCGDPEPRRSSLGPVTVAAAVVGVALYFSRSKLPPFFQDPSELLVRVKGYLPDFCADCASYYYKLLQNHSQIITDRLVLTKVQMTLTDSELISRYKHGDLIGKTQVKHKWDVSISGFITTELLTFNTLFGCLIAV